jgi:molybdopterin-binding protein
MQLSLLAAFSNSWLLWDCEKARSCLQADWPHLLQQYSKGRLQIGYKSESEPMICFFSAQSVENRTRLTPNFFRDRDPGTKCFKRKGPEIIPGAVNYEVVIKIGAGETIVAVTPQESVESPGLRAGWGA